jgi:DUF1680 family protein
LAENGEYQHYGKMNIQMTKIKKIYLLFLIALCLLSCRGKEQLPSGYPIQQVKLNQVELTDDFWLPKIRTIQEKTIRYAFDKCEEEGRLENFVTAGNVIRGGTGKVRGEMPFDDTDIYKIIEGAAYSLINNPNPDLENYLDSIIGIIAYGQEADGYLTTWRTIDPKRPPASWVKTSGDYWNGLDMSHELYNSGHLFEAATAYYWATGKRNFLDIALKNADLLVTIFGHSTNYEVPGHQIVEIGLIKLYQITGNADYLHLSKKFLDLRGDKQHRYIRGEYSQDHLPVTQQDEVVGHAVRAVYMYAGMTDIAALYGDSAYTAAIHRLWDNMICKKMYITGGLGSRHDGEAFGANYELPNLTAYGETCAAIGGVYWAERMFRLTGEAGYFDILERMLYNSVISGISLKGTKFFYSNPLEADGKYRFNYGSCTREAWFDCSCCPTNLIRFIPSIPNMIYAAHEDTLYVNLFMSNRAEIPLGKKIVKIEQQTEYPRNGKVVLRIKPENPRTFTLKIRIPSWAQNTPAPGGLYAYTNDAKMQPSEKPNTADGYYTITRTWMPDDSLSLDFPMEVRTVKVRPEVKEDAGKFSVEYGPLVYCMEEADNLEGFAKTASPQSFTVAWRPELLGGINLIEGQSVGSKCRLIPYYTWSNRGIGKMKVFFDSNPKEKQIGFTQWATTPPMGWNSWDCYGPTVEEHEVKANADYMAEYLKSFGWEYIVVDIRWFVENDKAGGYNQTDPRYVMDEYGRYTPAINRFPSAANGKGFKPLSDYIHSKGLKFGLHIMRGVPKKAVEKKLPIKDTPYTAEQIYSAKLQCKWLRDNYTILDKPGAQEYYNSIMELYASWGVDFIKVDDLSRPYHKREIEMIRRAIDRCGRPIVLSMSPGKTPVSEALHASMHASMWRMVDDVWDVWKDVTHLMQVAQDWYPYISPAWPDCDMIPLGRISIRGERGIDRMTRLTKDEQYSLMTFFTIFRSPLMFGGDLPSNDAFTLSLLTNEEVLRMHRESTDVRQLFQVDGKVAITSCNPVSGEHYLAVFNTSDNAEPKEITVNLSDFGRDKYRIVNMWTGESLGVASDTFSVMLPAHACGLYRLN